MRRTILILGILVVVVAGIAGYLALAPHALARLRPATVVTDRAKVDAAALAFVANPYQDDYGLLHTSGYVDNKLPAEMRSVVLIIQLSDKDGNKKEKVEYSVSDVPARGRRTFDATLGNIPAERTAEVSIARVEVVR